MSYFNLIFHIIFIFLLPLMGPMPDEPDFDLEVLYNGKLLPVDEVPAPELLPGDVFTIELRITPNIDSVVSLGLGGTAPGSYKVVSGPSPWEKTVLYRLKAHETLRVSWILTPTGEWRGGNAPVNVYYKVYNEGRYEDPIFLGKFTGVDPFIS